MTLVSQIIIDAFRQGNLLPIGGSPTVAQNAEALNYINRIVKSVFGNEVGDQLSSFPIGRNNINRPSGFPWWNNVPDINWFVPKNTRLILNVTTSQDIYLHPVPDEGSRLGAVDNSGTLSSDVTVTLHGNGNTIQGGTEVVLNTPGVDQEWFFRADLGQWLLYAPLALTDIFPFPVETEFFFIIQLAMALNPAYGQSMDPQTGDTYKRAIRQLRSRYQNIIPVRSELGLIRTAHVAADRDLWGNTYWLYQPNSMFDKGWPW